jgi:hypothetical protein
MDKITFKVSAHFLRQKKSNLWVAQSFFSRSDFLRIMGVLVNAMDQKIELTGR